MPCRLKHGTSVFTVSIMSRTHLHAINNSWKQVRIFFTLVVQVGSIVFQKDHHVKKRKKENQEIFKEGGGQSPSEGPSHLVTVYGKQGMLRSYHKAYAHARNLALLYFYNIILINRKLLNVSTFNFVS